MVLMNLTEAMGLDIPLDDESTEIEGDTDTEQV